MATLRIQVDVDPKTQQVRLSGDVYAGENILVTERSRIEFRFGPGTTNYEFAHLLVSETPLTCPPDLNGPTLPANGQFSGLSRLPATIVEFRDACTDEQMYDYAVAVRRTDEINPPLLWNDPRIINQPRLFESKADAPGEPARSA